MNAPKLVRPRSAPKEAADGFVYPRFPYRKPPEFEGARNRYPVVIVGGGMVGLTAAADLGNRGINCVLLDDNDTVASGSRAISQARRSFQIWDRVGAAKPMTAKGIQWTHARQLYRDKVVNDHELHPEKGHKYPPMTLLPQYYVENYLVERCAALGHVDLRWKNSVRGVRQVEDHVELEVETPDGKYTLLADWVIAADGVASTVRKCLGLPFEGRKIEDRFVIVDVKVDAPFPPGRSFWFRQNFHSGSSTLFLRQPDGVCRVDFNIGPEADAEEELKPENVEAKLRAMFGVGVNFDMKWISLYTVEVRRLDKFRHGRVLFAGDSAHQLSPFSGGRGGNSGIEDVDNLGWKLERVIRGQSPESLLDSYDAERIGVADENMRFSLRASEFITPSSALSAAFQEAALTLSVGMDFARAYLNSGRLSMPARYTGSPLIVSVDDGATASSVAPGCAVADAAAVDPQGNRVFLAETLGQRFCLLLSSAADLSAAHSVATRARDAGIDVDVVLIDGQGGRAVNDGVTRTLVDAEGLVAERYGLGTFSTYLFRPDQRVAGRWRLFDSVSVEASLRLACGLGANDTRAANAKMEVFK